MKELAEQLYEEHVLSYDPLKVLVGITYGYLCEVHITTSNGKSFHKVIYSGPSDKCEDIFNRMHIIIYGTPSNYTKNGAPKKNDFPWNMTEYMRIK